MKTSGTQIKSAGIKTFPAGTEPKYAGTETIPAGIKPKYAGIEPQIAFAQQKQGKPGYTTFLNKTVPAQRQVNVQKRLDDSTAPWVNI